MICKREFDLVATWLPGLQESCANVQQLLMACLQPISLLFFDISRVFLPRFVNVLWSFAALGIDLFWISRHSHYWKCLSKITWHVVWLDVFHWVSVGESGYLHGNHSRLHKLKIHNGCKYCHESGIRTRAQIGRRLRLREDRLGPGNEVANTLYSPFSWNCPLEFPM